MHNWILKYENEQYQLRKTNCSHATWKVQFNVLGYIFILTQLPFILRMYNMTKEFPVLILLPSRYQHFVLLQFKKLETSESSIYYTFVLD